MFRSNSSRPGWYGAARSTVLMSVMIAALLVLPARSLAQTDQGAITGIVQDSSGAIIPNAQITVAPASLCMASARRYES